MQELIVMTPADLQNLVADAVAKGMAQAVTMQANVNMVETKAAEYVGLDKSTLARYRCEKRGPAYVKAGSRVIYRKQDLDAWLEQGKIRTSDSDRL